MNIPFINLEGQYKAYKTEIDSAIAEVLTDGRFINGPAVRNFEQQLEQYLGCKHAIGCSSGTDALLLALMALGVGKGDEVIVPSFTFIASAEVVALLGATPVFVDVSLKDANMTANKIAEALSAKTKAVIVVNLFGSVAKYKTIFKSVKAYNAEICIIEDAAQSFGAVYKGKKSCTLGDISCTSFFPAKPLGCYGDGGAVFCEEDDLALKIRQIANHGQTKQYHYKYSGLNGRIDTIQAAILSVKLKNFDFEIKKRREVGWCYLENLKPEITPLEVFNKSNHLFALFTIVSEKRDKLKDFLASKNIPSAIYYPLPLHKQQVFQPISKSFDMKNTNQLADKVLSLPISPFLESSHQQYIIDSLNSF